MSTFIDIWMNWAYLFRSLPYGDYVAAFVLVAVVVFSARRVKSVLRLV